MPNISKRISLFSESAIARISHMAERYEAINLSEGFPDFPPPEALRNRLKDIASQGPHQYSIDSGAQNLTFAGQTLDPEQEVIVTCGGTEALMTTMMALVDPGDKVVVFSPFYEAYGTDVLLAGGEPIYVPLRQPDFTFDADVLEDAFRQRPKAILRQPDFTFDADALEDAFRQRPKAIILCNPSNPCGKVFSKAELEIIAGLVQKYDAFAIVDEVYEHIVYSCISRRNIRTFPICRACTNGPYLAVPCRRPIRLRDGASATSSRRLIWPRRCGSSTCS